MSDVAAFAPTHVAPSGGLRSWVVPGGEAAAPVPPDLEVQVLERTGDWARVLCWNGWSTWVDGRELIDIGQIRAHAEALLTRLDAALKAYEQVVNDAVARRLEPAEFQRRAFEAGMIVNDGEAWFLDLPNGRWCRYDGLAVDILDLGKG